MFHGNNKISNIFHLNDVIQKIMYKDEIVYTSYYTYTLSGVLPLKFWSVGKPLLEYEIDGKTYQATTPSPESPVEVQGVGVKTGNLFDMSKIDKTSSINVVIPLDLKNGYTYTFSCESEGTGIALLRAIRVGEPSSDVDLNCGMKNGVYTLHRSITADYSVYSSYFLRYYQPRTNTVSKIQINEGSEPLPYEPYGYKIPILIQGKNLYNKDSKDISKGYGTSKYITTQGNTGFSSNHDISEYIYVKGFSYFTYSNQQLQSIIACAFYDINKQYISVSPLAVNTIAVPTNAYYMRFTIRKTNVDDLQIEFGEIATPYEPYTETTTNIYTDRQLYSGDKLAYPQNERTNKTGVLILDGSENWATQVLEDFVQHYVNIKNHAAVKPSEIKAFCTHFKYRGDPPDISVCDKVFGFGGSVWNGNVTFPTTKSLAEFKAYLTSEYAKGTPVTVYYPLEAATTEPITLPEIGTLQGNNLLSVQTEVQPEYVTIRYKTDKAVEN